jgi:hypothetical protein
MVVVEISESKEGQYLVDLRRVTAAQPLSTIEPGLLNPEATNAVSEYEGLQDRNCVTKLGKFDPIIKKWSNLEMYPAGYANEVR